MKNSQTLYSFYKPHARVYAKSDNTLITKQSHKAECDINTILSQYKKTGIINHINNATANYQDLPDTTDYQFACNTILQAQDAFSQLPSKVRDFYQNDPAVFLSALEDPSQRSQLEEWGIFKKAPEPFPQPSAEPAGDAKK